jgi:acetyl esterase/lipase
MVRLNNEKMMHKPYPPKPNIRRTSPKARWVILALLGVFLTVAILLGGSNIYHNAFAEKQKNFREVTKKQAERQHGPHEQYGAKAEIIIRDVPYASGVPGDEKLKLDIYSNPHEGAWPVVVVIHGGAWVGGDKTMDNKVFVSKMLAANGYVVFTVNYRLAPKVTMKEQVEDVMAAVIWVKEHARDYGGDGERIGVAGGSAGGQFSALVAWASGDPYFIPTGNPGPQNSRVKVAALYYPVIDLDRTFKANATKLGAINLRALFSAGQTYDEALKHLSPHNYLSSAVPTIFLTGDADELNLYPQSVEYSQKLRDLGVDSRLYTAPGKRHCFTFNYWEPESSQSVQEIVGFFDKYLKRAQD